jgi:hypothetical protein
LFGVTVNRAAVEAAETTITVDEDAVAPFVSVAVAVTR